MTITEIKNNIDKLNELNKELLINYVHELLTYHQRQDSKIISLQTDIKFYTRHLKKVRDMIDKSISSKIKSKEQWSK